MWHDKLENCCSLSKEYKTERNAIKYCKKADWLWYYCGTPVINSLKMIRLCELTCPLSYKYIEHIRKYILERIKKISVLSLA